jgi:hypothetical protein
MPDDEGDVAPDEAARSAGDAFPDNPPGAVAACDAPKPGATGGAGTPSWKPEDIKKALDSCDGGTGVYAAAKAANGGKDPTIQVGNSVIGSGGSVDYTTGTITLDPGFDKCNTIETLIQELSNLSHKADFEAAGTQCGAGTLSREDYIKANEKAEYDGVRRALQAEAACTKKWGCTKNSFSYAGITGKATTDFNEYYDKWLSTDHKEYWGKAWDASCKAAYDAKHAAPPPPPPSPSPAKSGCFIATAAYGSALAPEVQFLRELRDNVLRRTGWGSRFFEEYWRRYYEFSPGVAAQMDQDPEFRRIIRWSVVTPMINYLKWTATRPREWNFEGLDPELRRFLEQIKRDMDAWLDEIQVPESFEGTGNDMTIAELNIALDFVLKGKPAAAVYLPRLVEKGVLPLRFSRCAEARLLEQLLRAGRAVEEINLILYGQPGEDPALGRIKALGT